MRHIFEDLGDLRELRDIQDELGMMGKVLDDQTCHIESTLDVYERVLALKDSTGAEYLREALSDVAQYKHKIDTMIDKAGLAKQGVS